MRKIYQFLFILMMNWSIWSPASQAGLFEISFGFAFTRSDFSETDFTWNRRWSSSVGYHFTATSGFEISLQMVTTRTFIQSFQNTVFNDRIYSLNYVQSFFPRSSPVQPVLKFGVGQLDRTATGEYAGGGQPPAQLLSLSIVMGAGIKWFVVKNFAVRLEGTSYLEGGSIRSFGDNFSLQFGTSFFF